MEQESMIFYRSFYEALRINVRRKFTSGTTRRTEKSELLIRRNTTRLTESRLENVSE